MEESHLLVALDHGERPLLGISCVSAGFCHHPVNLAKYAAQHCASCTAALTFSLPCPITQLCQQAAERMTRSRQENGTTCASHQASQEAVILRTVQLAASAVWAITLWPGAAEWILIQAPIVVPPSRLLWRILFAWNKPSCCV